MIACRPPAPQQRWPILRSVRGAADQFGPPIEHRQDLIGLGRWQRDDGAGDTLLLIALQAIEIFGRAKDRYRDIHRVATGITRHLPKLRQKLGDVGIVLPAGVRDPAIAIASGAPRAVWK